MNNQDNSQTVKAGSITYFFDVKETRQRKPYLLITMSRFKGEGEDWDRVSIPLFPEHARTFVKTFLEMAQNLPVTSDIHNGYSNAPRPQVTATQMPLRGVRPQRSRPMASTDRR